MKGIINRGVQEFCETRFGGEAWEAISRDAGCDEPSFSPGLDYPDQMTVDLITSASRRLDITADNVMIEFGKFWVPNSGKNAYPALFALAGDNPRDFLRHMDLVHKQVTLSRTGARPPKLTPEDLPDGRLEIHYVSERKLCPVAHGLILGVGIYFDQELVVAETACTRRGDEECVFEVSFL